MRLEKLKNPKLGKKRSTIWYRQAEYDLQAAKTSLRTKFYEWTAYQAEQAVEKAFKAIIVQAGFIAPRTHKLSVLIGMCNGLNPIFAKTKFEFRALDSYTQISRYPFLIPNKHETPHDSVPKKDACILVTKAEDILFKLDLILQKKNPSNFTSEEEYINTQVEVDIDERIKEVTDILKNTFDPQKIVLYGSYARDRYAAASSLDILVVADSRLSFFERIQKAREVTKGNNPTIEPLVYTPEEFRFMIEEEGEGYLEKAITEGEILYQKY